MLAAPPSSVALLTPAGATPVPWVMTPAGIAVNMSAIAPMDTPVALGTYFKQYNASIADNAPCATRDCSVYTAANYSYAHSEGFCLRAPSLSEPTVAATLYFNGNTDNMAAAAPPQASGWQVVDTECYAYVASAPGRWALEVWYNAALSDYWTLASPASRAQASGSGYSFVSTVGYVLQDGGGAQNATVASWGYVLKVAF